MHNVERSPNEYNFFYTLPYKYIRNREKSNNIEIIISISFYQYFKLFCESPLGRPSYI